MANPRIRLYVAMSVDGYIADREGGVGWLDAFDTPDAHESYGAFIKDIGAVIMGRATYEQERGFGPWPYAEQRTIVVSSRALADPPPHTSSVTIEALPACIRELRAGDKDAWLVGGGRTVRAFQDRGEIDEYEIHVIPVLLGDGLPLFPPGGAPADLKLAAHEARGNGAAMLRFVKAGAS
jgi:dihydrofolate reductase